MTGTMADIRVIQDLLHTPSVSNKVRRLGVPLEGRVQLAPNLILEGEKRHEPRVFSVLDVLMLEGCNALVAVTFAVFDLAQDELLKCGTSPRSSKCYQYCTRLTDVGPLLRSARNILLTGRTS